MRITPHTGAVFFIFYVRHVVCPYMTCCTVTDGSQTPLRLVRYSTQPVDSVLGYVGLMNDEPEACIYFCADMSAHSYSQVMPFVTPGFSVNPCSLVEIERTDR